MDYPAPPMDKRRARRMGRRIVDWYERNARELPWRCDPTPYRVLVSEVMLQQTAVGSAARHFGRWMARFPTVQALAAAGEQEVLAAWEGLGYYRRALHLRRAAERIVREHGGRVPRDREALLRLPGVGPYVASAVRSLAFGEDEAALDANVVRVFMRLMALDGTGREASVKAAVRRAAEVALPAGGSAAFNQGLMDFGSLICRPRAPTCGECFLRRSCGAFRQGRQYEVPRRSPKRLRKIRTAVALLVRGREVYLQKRPAEGMFAGMWEFPGGKVRPGEAPRAAVVRECLEELGADVEVERKLLALTHYYTVYEVRLHAFVCRALGELPADRTHRWVAFEEIGDCPMPSANRRVVEHLTRP